jgi:hypothetical protein
MVILSGNLLRSSIENISPFRLVKTISSESVELTSEIIPIYINACVRIILIAYTILDLMHNELIFKIFIHLTFWSIKFYI